MRGGKRARVARLVIAAWVVGALVLCAFLLGGHLLTLPKPAYADQRLNDAILASRTPASTGRWLVLHFLYERCQCSAQVVEHLLARRATPLAAERVVFVGEPGDLSERIRAAGFELETPTVAELEARYGVLAAPLMVIADPSNAVKYVGGYTNRKQSPVVRDTELLAKVTAGESPEPLPLFGCAVSKKLNKATDPLGLRP